jgi:hypothetical protein
MVANISRNSSAIWITNWWLYFRHYDPVVMMAQATHTQTAHFTKCANLLLNTKFSAKSDLNNTD